MKKLSICYGLLYAPVGEIYEEVALNNLAEIENITTIDRFDSSAVLKRDYQILEARRIGFYKALITLEELLESSVYLDKPDGAKIEDLKACIIELYSVARKYSEKTQITITNIDRFIKFKPLRICDDEVEVRSIRKTILEANGITSLVIVGFFLHFLEMLWDAAFSSWYHSRDPSIDRNSFWALLIPWYAPFQATITAWMHCVALYNATYCNKAVQPYLAGFEIPYTPIA